MESLDGSGFDVYVRGEVVATETTHEHAWKRAAEMLGTEPVIVSQSPTKYGYTLRQQSDSNEAGEPRV